MALFLVEVELAEASREQAEAVIDKVGAAFATSGGTLVEAQVVAGHSRIYVILEGDECAGVVLSAADLAGAATVSETIPVRIVGTTVDEVRARGVGAGYLVEWDIPEEITMDMYLAAKKTKSPLYETLDDVAFLRTYVREDTQKCLCFYDADNEDAVRRAREVVSTPISRLYELDGQAATV